MNSHQTSFRRLRRGLYPEGKSSGGQRFEETSKLRPQKLARSFCHLPSALCLQGRSPGQIKVSPGRVATGAAIAGVTGAIAYKLGKKAYAEVKAFRRNGKLVKAHRRKVN